MSRIGDRHLLFSAFGLRIPAGHSREEAVKWKIQMGNHEKIPPLRDCPKYKSKKREIWTAEPLLNVTELCDDLNLKLVVNLAFSASLRIGEV